MAHPCWTWTLNTYAEPNQTELMLLQVAFGPTFNFAKLKEWTPSFFAHNVARAKERLSQALLRILPPRMAMTFDLQSVEADHRRLAVSLLVLCHSPYDG